MGRNKAETGNGDRGNRGLEEGEKNRRLRMNVEHRTSNVE